MSNSVTIESVANEIHHINQELKIDAEFQEWLLPLSMEEYNQLERNLISHGCREPLVTWNGILLDGAGQRSGSIEWICDQVNDKLIAVFTISQFLSWVLREIKPQNSFNLLKCSNETGEITYSHTEEVIH